LIHKELDSNHTDLGGVVDVGSFAWGKAKDSDKISPAASKAAVLILVNMIKRMDDKISQRAWMLLEEGRKKSSDLP